ncbi:MAG: hypothetical protein JO264_15520 [Acidisphaera sp.]|nr:hypothetical protein [Acidisphaera sp.]
MLRRNAVLATLAFAAMTALMPASAHAEWWHGGGGWRGEGWRSEGWRGEGWRGGYGWGWRGPRVVEIVPPLYAEPAYVAPPVYQPPPVYVAPRVAYAPPPPAYAPAEIVVAPHPRPVVVHRPLAHPCTCSCCR